METGNNVLESAIDLMEEACSITMEESAADWTTRQPLVRTLNAYYDAIVDLANTRLENDYIYSGSRTDNKPFSNETTVSGGVAGDLCFDLADSAAGVTIEIADSSGDVVRTLTLSSGTAGANTVSWDGLDDSGIPVPDGEYEYSVVAEDAAGDAVAACHSYRGGDQSKKVIMGENSEIKLNNDGGDIFSDALMVLQKTITAMERGPYDTTEVSALLDEMDDALEKLKTELVALSVQYARLETRDANLDESLLLLENEISGLWLTDSEAAAVELQTVETAYEITLETAGILLNIPNLIGIL